MNKDVLKIIIKVLIYALGLSDKRLFRSLYIDVSKQGVYRDWETWEVCQNLLGR